MSTLSFAVYDKVFLKKLGQRIRYLRAVKCDASQAQLATHAGISASTISRVELAETEIVTSRMKDIADALGVEMYDLMDVDQNEMKELTDVDVELRRLYAQVDRLDRNQRRVIASTIQGVLHGFQNTMQESAPQDKQKKDSEEHSPTTTVRPIVKRRRNDLSLRA